MGPNLVVIRGISLEAATQMPLAEDDQMIEALAPSRTDEPLDVSVLPGRTRGNWMIANGHRTNAPGVRRPERSVAVAEQMARRFVPWKGFCHLACDPLRRWIGCDGDP